MNSLGDEVTVKVREAIRAKLNEMKANSSDEIIDYIMLLVTTKKTTAELAKSIDFVMENNTDVFVKWLSTVIKSLQQVTVSTTKNDVSTNLQVPKDSITNNEKHQTNDILICETYDEELNVLDKTQEKNMCASSQNKKKSENNVSELYDSKYNKNIMVSPGIRNKIKEKITFFSTEVAQTKNSIQTSKQNINDNSVNKIKSNLEISCDRAAVSRQNICISDENIDQKSKRPRISINNDDKDEKNVMLRLPITFKEAPKQTNRELPKKSISKITSQVTVKTQELNKNTENKVDKKPSLNNLIVQRVDHQRGALALDTAFKYIQQQIGATDKDVSVVKKWRDYAVEMLRSCKKV